MSRNSYQNKLNLIKSTISELENSSFESSKPEAFPQVNPLKRNIENSAEEMVPPLKLIFLTMFIRKNTNKENYLRIRKSQINCSK